MELREGAMYIQRKREMEGDEDAFGDTMNAYKNGDRSLAEELPGFFGNMTFMDDLTSIESNETTPRTPRRSHRGFSLDENEEHLPAVQEENEQNEEPVFRESFMNARPSPTVGRSRAVSFDQRVILNGQELYAPAMPAVRQRSASEYCKYQEQSIMLPSYNIFDAYFDEGLSDTLASSRESHSVPSSPYTPSRSRRDFRSSSDSAPASLGSYSSSSTSTGKIPLNPWSREFQPSIRSTPASSPKFRSTSSSRSPQQRGGYLSGSAEPGYGSAATPVSLANANIYSPEYLNPEFYAAAGGSVGGTLGGLYSSYGYAPPKIESADGMVYQVKFKYVSKFYLLAPTAMGVAVGNYVKVEADRGEDIGLVIATTQLEGFKESRLTIGRHGLQHGDFKHVLRAATEEEKYMLPLKLMEEEKALEICRDKVFEHRLNMRILDAEYQFDRHKLIFYFDADKRVDFRAMVSDLFALYKTRIWMQQAQIEFFPNEVGEMMPQLIITKQFASP